MTTERQQRDTLLWHLQNFLCAGSSALLLSVAHIDSQFWFLAAFALIPFLWRVVKARFSDALVLGAILGGFYAFICYPDELLISAAGFARHAIFLSAVFSAFGIAVRLIVKHLGFNPVLIALAWLPLEYALGHLAGWEHIFGLSDTASGLVLRFASLFGLLMISFAIVLINTMVLLVLDYVAGPASSKLQYICEDQRAVDFPLVSNKPQEHAYRLPLSRAPPCGLVCNLS